MHAKVGYTSFRTFPFIHALFSILQSSQYILAMMLDPCCKGLGLIIQYVGKERAFQIPGEYDRAILFPLLVCAYKFLNPTNVSERVLNFALESSQSTSLYDLVETDEHMALLVVKEQLTHFKIRKSLKRNARIQLHGGEPMMYIIHMLGL
jgi:hypothetical protein